MSHIIILTRQKLFGHFFFPFHKYISNISDNLWDEGCGINPLRQILYGLAMPLHPATVR